MARDHLADIVHAVFGVEVKDATRPAITLSEQFISKSIGSWILQTESITKG